MEKEFEKNYHRFEKEHFWFLSRRRIIINLVKEFPANSKILDIGCSAGFLIEDLINSGFKKENVYGIDISPQAINTCNEKGLLNCFIDDAEQPESLNTKFDLIIASDCLEHLENESKAINSWFNLLKDEGTLIVFVPAYQFLWSYHDEVNFHFRRYTRKKLNKLIETQQLKILKSGYWNFFLFSPILLTRIFFKNTGKNKKIETGDLNKIPSLNWLFKLILYTENFLLNYLNFPFGVSTFSISKKSIIK